MKRLALLDVDGTLTDTVDVDLRCFLETLESVFGFSADPAAYDFAAIPHATDPGFLEGAFAQHAGRAPTASDCRTFERRFVEVLALAAERRPRDFAPVAGAETLVAALSASADWWPAVATGCWRRSAVLKLDRAGLAAAGPPVASASDAVSRREIFALARARARRLGAGPRTVLVGDGTWDAETARRLDMPFVGVARGGRAAELERLGAVAVVPDFGDLAAALEALESAAAQSC